MLIVMLIKITYFLKEPNLVSMYMHRVVDIIISGLENNQYVTMLSEVVQNNLQPEGPNIVSMYIEQWTYYRVREQSVCNNAQWGSSK